MNASIFHLCVSFNSTIFWKLWLNVVFKNPQLKSFNAHSFLQFLLIWFLKTCAQLDKHTLKFRFKTPDIYRTNSQIIFTHSNGILLHILRNRSNIDIYSFIRRCLITLLLQSPIKEKNVYSHVLLTLFTIAIGVRIPKCKITSPVLTLFIT